MREVNKYVKNDIHHNNFIDNNPNAIFEYLPFSTLTTRWIRNYWDDWFGLGPKRIKGTFHIPIPHPINPQDLLYPWIDRDWLPRIIPYDIEVVI